MVNKKPRAKPVDLSAFSVEEVVQRASTRGRTTKTNPLQHTRLAAVHGLRLRSLLPQVPINALQRLRSQNAELLGVADVPRVVAELVLVHLLREVSSVTRW